MDKELFNKVEMFEQVPTALLKEVKSDEINLSTLTSHTEAPQFDIPNGTSQPPTGETIPPTTSAQQLNVGNIVTPDMAAQLFNIVLPAAMVLLINRFTDKKVVKQQFEATSKELDIIKPVLQNYLNSINFTVESPFNALLLTLSVVYGSKAIEALNGQAKGTIKTADFTPPPVAAQERKQPTGGRKPRPTGMKYNKKM